MMGRQPITDPGGEIKISFGYHCTNSPDDSGKDSDGIDMRPGSKLRRANSSFSCLSGAALSANATLANMNICNGLFGSLSNLSCSPSSPSELAEDNSSSLRSTSAPSRSDSFLNATEAADFLAGTLYETIRHYLGLLDRELEQECKVEVKNTLGNVNKGSSVDCSAKGLPNLEIKKSCMSFKQRVLNSPEQALIQAENDFLHMVEQEMDNRPDLVSIGSCVLVVFLLGKNMYVLNAGDSQAVLATNGEGIGANSDGRLQAVQLAVSHTVDDESERIRLLKNHPEDPSPIIGGKVKGKLKVTRALGVGYLKKKSMNEALMGILRVRNLISPPYISVQPSLIVHEISSSDHFAVLGNDGQFDFFNNNDVVKLVRSYIQRYPFGDPAKFLVEQLVMRAADCALRKSILSGRRRKYHDDVTVIVIVLGMNKRTTKASTRL
ncbi:unnamed protein product [Withania somnifera]